MLFKSLVAWCLVIGVTFFLGCDRVEVESVVVVVERAVEVGAVDVMSFNVRYGSADDGANSWKYRKGLVFDTIEKAGADVVGLQEALRFQIDEIRENVSGYEEVGVAREAGGEYCTILYNGSRFELADGGTFWLSETPDVVESISWDSACVRICTWAKLVEKSTGDVLWVYNAHLDHVSQLAREKGVELVARRIAERGEDGPFVLMGDFNAGEDNAVVKYLTGAGMIGGAKVGVVMVDTFRVIQPDAEEVGTFNGFAGKSDGAKIDFIFTQAGTEVLDAAIVRDNVDGRYASDHFAVTAKIKLGDLI